MDQKSRGQESRGVRRIRRVGCLWNVFQGVSRGHEARVRWVGEIRRTVSQESVPATFGDTTLVGSQGQQRVVVQVGDEGVFVDIVIPVAVDSWVACCTHTRTHNAATRNHYNGAYMLVCDTKSSPPIKKPLVLSNSLVPRPASLLPSSTRCAKVGT